VGLVGNAGAGIVVIVGIVGHGIINGFPTLMIVFLIFITHGRINRENMHRSMKKLKACMECKCREAIYYSVSSVSHDTHDAPNIVMCPQYRCGLSWFGFIMLGNYVDWLLSFPGFRPILIL
jgi:hypothetical protein